MRRPRGIDYTSDDELPMLGGHADGMHLPYDLDDVGAAQLEEELHEKLARKRPPGFAPWPDEQSAASHLRIA